MMPLLVWKQVQAQRSMKGAHVRKKRSRYKFDYDWQICETQTSWVGNFVLVGNPPLRSLILGAADTLSKKSATICSSKQQEVSKP